MKPVTLPGEDPGGLKLVQWIGLIGLIALFGIIYVWQQVQTRDLKRDILWLEARKGKLTEDNTRLSLQVARLSKSDVIQPLAYDLLQLDYPTIGQIVTVPDREVVAERPSSVVPAKAALLSSARLVPW